MLKPEQLEDLHRIAGEIKSLDHMYGSGLMTPFANKVNSSRAAMTFQQIAQAKNLDNPEIARVSTGYEKVYGDRSTSYLKSDRDYEVVKKIRKFDNDMVYALVLKEKKSNYYHIVIRNAVESFAESSGVGINNSVIDSKKPGDKIKKDEVIYRSNSYDEEMNYRLGVNAKTVYLVWPEIVEDAMLISESLQKKLKSTSVLTYTIPKNSNDILLNLYGGNGPYKAFPDVGEKVKDRILCGRRRVDYNSAQYLMKSKHLRKEMFGDVLYYTDTGARVVDIDIYCNADIDELPDDGAHKQINKYLKSIRNYWQELHDTLGEIMDDPDNQYSDEVGLHFSRARDALSVGKRVRWNTEMSSVFDNMIINITVAKSSMPTIGSKLVGRHGNKGVISGILPDDMMPMNEDGEHVEIVYNALGMIARLNPSQLYEVETNWVVDTILKSDGTNEQKFEALLDVLALINPDQEKLVKVMYDTLDKEEKKAFLKEITTEFVVFQSAEKSLSFKNYDKLISKYKPKKRRFTIKNADGSISKIQRKLIMSDSYVYRLKHEPITKFSARSKGTINPRTFLPIKSHAYSRGTALFNNQAIKLGSMEMDVLRLCNDQAALNYMTRLYCTSVVGRRQFDKLLNTDIFSEEMQIDMDNYKSRVVEMFDATLLAIGMQLDLKYGDTEPVEMPLMDSLAEMSKKNVRLVFKPEYLASRK